MQSLSILKQRNQSGPISRYLPTVVVLLLFLPGCVSAPGAGVNRMQVFSETPSVVLPFKIVVGQGSKKTEQGTFLMTGASPGSMGSGALPSEIGAQALTTLVDKARRDAKMRETFLAGEAFESSMMSVSPTGAKSIPTLHVELVHCLPVEDRRLWPFKGPYLTMHLTFNAWFEDCSDRGTQSIYRLDYEFGWSDNKNDILREMMDYAVAHWAKELASNLGSRLGIAEFPSSRYGNLKADKAKCYFQLFYPISRAEQSEVIPGTETGRLSESTSEASSSAEQKRQ